MENDMFSPDHVSGNGRVLSATDVGLERKFARFGDGITVEDGTEISGYASLFGAADQGGDVVTKGAYAVSLAA